MIERQELSRKTKTGMCLIWQKGWTDLGHDDSQRSEDKAKVADIIHKRKQNPWANLKIMQAFFMKSKEFLLKHANEPHLWGKPYIFAGSQQCYAINRLIKEEAIGTLYELNDDLKPQIEVFAGEGLSYGEKGQLALELQMISENVCKWSVSQLVGTLHRELSPEEIENNVPPAKLKNLRSILKILKPKICKDQSRDYNSNEKSAAYVWIRLAKTSPEFRDRVREMEERYAEGKLVGGKKRGRNYSVDGVPRIQQQCFLNMVTKFDERDAIKLMDKVLAGELPLSELNNTIKAKKQYNNAIEQI
jgi:hypothetical protein